jgi:poly(3-hydroxyalkanoate) synthetase
MSSSKSTGLLGGDVRVVLNSGGHIAGIVNPSNPRSRALTSDAIRRAPSSGAARRAA